jgi:exosortase
MQLESSDAAAMSNRRRILRALALASLAGTVVGVSPLVPKHWLGALAAGVVSGLGVFVFLLRRAEDTQPAVAASAPVPPTVAAALVLWAALFAPTWIWLYHQWTTSLWSNQHGIFVPLVLAYLVRETLRDDPEPQREEASAWGFAWIALGGTAALLDAGVETGYLATVGLIASLPGVSLLLLGRRRTRALAVPLAIALLMMPIPRTLATDMHLRHMTATGVEWVLHGLGVTAYREATVIHMPGRAFIVSEACSGFATLYAGVAVAIVLAASARSMPRRLALIAAAPVLAVVANVARVFLLIVLTQQFGSWILDSFVHPATGVVTFVIVITGPWLVAGRRGLRPPSLA